MKETWGHTESINNLKEQCLQQEIVINKLRADLDMLKVERQVEMNCNAQEVLLNFNSVFQLEKSFDNAKNNGFRNIL